MEEHTLSERISIYERIIKDKPLSVLPNVLHFTYLSLAKKYEEILDYAMQFSMNASKTNILIEDFCLLGYIGAGDIKNSKTQVHYNFSIDPEDAYAHLLNSIVQKTEGKNFLDEIKKAYLFLVPEERKIFIEKVKTNDTIYGVIKNIDTGNLTVQKIQEKINGSNAENFVFKLSASKLSSAASLLKAGKKDEAEVEVRKVLNLHPYYARALYFASEITDDPHKKADYLRKIFEVNLLSVYLKGKESAFVREGEKTMFNELRELFESNNPFIAFFQGMMFPKERSKIPINTDKIHNEEVKPLMKSNQRDGFNELKNRKYIEALTEFIRMLKEEGKQ